MGISLLEKDGHLTPGEDWQLALGSFHQVHGRGVSSPSAGDIWSFPKSWATSYDPKLGHSNIMCIEP